MSEQRAEEKEKEEKKRQSLQGEAKKAQSTHEINVSRPQVVRPPLCRRVHLLKVDGRQFPTVTDSRNR
jgi:hypothetical protein